MPMRTCLLAILLFFGTMGHNIAAAQGAAPLPVGFDVADVDQNGEISQRELTQYFRQRIPDVELPWQVIFEQMDRDTNGTLSKPEFDTRHAILDAIMAQLDIAPLEVYGPPVDPGPDFIPFSGLDRPVDDGGIYGAIYHRYVAQLKQPEAWESAGWKPMNMEQLPNTVKLQLPNKENKNAGKKPNLEDLCKATLVIGGGGSAEGFFSAGAVIISPGGLAMTNFHVAEVFNDKLLGITSDGQIVRVTRLLAGDREADIAIVQLDKTGLPWVALATKAPEMAQDVVVIHHTENRFYTYDRGYVKRYASIRKRPWMEISAPYAPGGSGCGIFNADYDLVGLVSMITMGDGPAIAEQDLTAPIEEGDEEEWSTNAEIAPPGMLVVRLAVPWMALHAISTGEPGPGN